MTFLPFALTKLMVENFKLGITHLLQEELCQILMLTSKGPFQEGVGFFFFFNIMFSPVLKIPKSNGYVYNCLDFMNIYDSSL